MIISKLAYTHKTIVNIYIVYELGASTSNDNDPTLKNCLFGPVALTKNADIDNYGYSGHEIGFDRRSSFSFPGGGFDQNVLILEQIGVLLLIFIIRKKTYWFLEKDQHKGWNIL